MTEIMDRPLGRRDFLKLTVGSVMAMGLGAFRVPGFTEAVEAAVAETPVLWFLAGTCTGCTVSMANSVSPSIKEILIDEVIPGHHLNVQFHPTLMAGQGELAQRVLEETGSQKGGFVLVVEGVVATKDGGVYCEVGERNGQGVKAVEWITQLGQNAIATIALGACASYGGVPGAAPNPTGVKGVAEIFKERGVGTPVVNVPGCPPHPDWFVGTVATVLLNIGGGLGQVVTALDLDEHGRPKAFYGQLVHSNCERRAYFDEGIFAKKFSDPGCLYELGCKGPVTYADCPIRRWNNHVNWCVGCGRGCIGCTEPTFPDGMSPLRNRVSGVTLPGVRTTADKVGIGLAAVTAVGLGAHLVGSAARGRLGKGAEE